VLINGLARQRANDNNQSINQSINQSNHSNQPTCSSSTITYSTSQAVYNIMHSKCLLCSTSDTTNQYIIQQNSSKLMFDDIHSPVQQ